MVKEQDMRETRKYLEMNENEKNIQKTDGMRWKPEDGNLNLWTFTL